MHLFERKIKKKDEKYRARTEQAVYECPSCVSCQHPPLLILQRPGPVATNKVKKKKTRGYSQPRYSCLD